MQAQTNNEGQSHTEFELTVPDAKPVVLSAGLVTYLGSLLVETVEGPDTYTHRFTTLTTDFLEKYVKNAMAEGTPRLRFRHGVGDHDKIFWLPWQTHVITGTGGGLQGLADTSGHLLELDTACDLFLLDRGNKTIARKGKISAIVQQIAEENKIANTIIEPTITEILMIQSYDTDQQFIRKRLLRRAANSKGRGNYLFFMHDDILHFHTPDYHTALKEIFYHQSPSSSLAQIDESQNLFDDGVSGTRLVAYDPYSGTAKETVSDPGRALRLANSIYQLKNVKGAERTIFYHVVNNREEEALNLGQNTYEHARTGTFRVKLGLRKIIGIRAGDFLRLTVTTAAQKASPWSGFYLVEQVEHSIVKNAIDSMYTLKRGELQNIRRGNITVDNNMALTSEQEAPGHDLNLKEAQSSDMTKGAGRSSTGAIFSTTQDPNTG